MSVRTNCIFDQDKGSLSKLTFGDHALLVINSSVVASFASTRLHLPAQLVKNQESFLVLSSNVGDDIRILQALLLYAVYTATNIIRFRKIKFDQSGIHEFLLQILHQGAAQSSRAEHPDRDALASRPHKRTRTSLSHPPV